MLLRYHFNLIALAFLAFFHGNSEAAPMWRRWCRIFQSHSQAVPPGTTDANITSMNPNSPPTNQEEAISSQQSITIPISSPNINISRNSPVELPKLPNSPSSLYDSGNLQGSFNKPSLTTSRSSVKDAIGDEINSSRGYIQKFSLKKNSSLMKELVNRATPKAPSGFSVQKRSSNGSPPSNSSSLRMSQHLVRNLSNNSQEEQHFSPFSSQHFKLSLNKGSSITDQISQSDSQSLPPLSIDHVGVAKKKSRLKKQNVSESSTETTEMSEGQYFFSRQSFPINPEERLNLETRFGKFTVSEERLLSENSVLDIEREMSRSAFLTKEFVDNHIFVIDNYFGQPILANRPFSGRSGLETVLTGRALEKFPVNSQDLIKMNGHSITPTYGLIYLKLKPFRAISLNIYQIEAVSPIICTEMQLYISVIIKAGVVLTFKREGGFEDILSVPTWRLVDHPDKLFDKEVIVVPNSKSVLIDSVLAELCLLINPYFIITQNPQEDEQIVLSYLYPFQSPQKPASIHIIRKLDCIDDSLLEPTIHLNSEDCPEALWWSAKPQGDILFRNEEAFKFFRLIPNGSPWFEINGIGRGDLFRTVLADLNFYVLEDGNIYVKYLIPGTIRENSDLYNPRAELIHIRGELLKQWRICQENYQSTACQTARTLATLYVFRLLKICFHPIKSLYVNEKSVGNFKNLRTLVIQRIDYLSTLNEVACDWLGKSFQKSFFLYTKLALIEDLKFNVINNKTCATRRNRPKAELNEGDEYTVSHSVLTEEQSVGVFDFPPTSKGSVDNSRAVDSGVEDSDPEALNESELAAFVASNEELLDSLINN